MPNARRLITAVTVCTLVCLCLPGGSTLRAAPADQLGNVNFPTTCSGEVQPTLEKGLALLAKSYPAWQKAQRRVTERLGPDGVAALKSVTKKLGTPS